MRCSLASLIAIAVVAPALAAADPRPMAASARRELLRGGSLFDAKDYAGAISAFDAGYAIDPHPDFLYAKGQAQRTGGDCRGAVASYEAFLETKPPRKEATRAKANIARCKQLLRVSGPSRDPEPAPRDSGDPEPAARRADQVTTRRAREDVVERRRWWTDGAGLVLAGLGTACVVTGGTFAWLARTNAADAATTDDLDVWYELHDAHARDRAVAGVTAGIGAALIAAGILRFAWVGASDDRRVTATASRDGAAVWLGGTW